MKRLLSLAVLGAAFGLLGNEVSANDSTFGGAGVNLVPIQNDEIRMADELVILQQTYRGWHVTVTFHFKNESANAQKVVIGFPFKGRSVTGDYDDVSWKQELAKNFKSTVRGKELPSRKIEIRSEKDQEAGKPGLLGKDSSYTHAYVWDVEFAPNETVEIVNSYDTGANYMPDGSQWAEYILKTGKNWKGNQIGRSQIEVRFIEDVVLCDEMTSAQKNNCKGIEYCPCTITDTATTIKGYKIEGQGSNRKMVWDLPNFAPEKDLDVYYVPRYVFMGYQEIGAFSSCDGDGNKVTYSCEELRLLRNGYYAILGYPFKSADLKAHFGKKAWYKENPQFDAKKLPKTQQDWLAEMVRPIAAAEKAQGCKK